MPEYFLRLHESGDAECKMLKRAIIDWMRPLRDLPARLTQLGA